LTRYPLMDPNRAPETIGSVISHYNPKVGISNCLYLHTATRMRERIGMPIYEFEFADPNALVLGVGIAATPDPMMEFGAVHSSALNYLFPHLSNTSRIDAPDLLQESQPLADQMQQVVATFAAKGVPSAAGLPTWPLFRDGTNVMRLMPGHLRRRKLPQLQLLAGSFPRAALVRPGSHQHDRDHGSVPVRLTQT